MNLLKLSIVVLLDKYKKITDVAQALNLKQPTVSFHMKSLEEELGVTLFQSRQGRVVLTEAGRALFPYAQKIMSLTGEAQRTMEQFKEMERGKLRVGIEVSAERVIMPAVGQFLTEFSGLQIEVSIEKEATLKKLLVQGEIELAVMHQQENMALEFVPLFEDEVVLICHKDHALASLDKLEPNEAGQARFIQHGEGSMLRNYSESWANAQGLHLWSSLTVDSPEAVRTAVKSGSGVAFFTLSGLSSPEEMDQLVTLSVESQGTPNSRIALGAFYRSEGGPGELIKTFVSYLERSVCPEYS